MAANHVSCCVGVLDVGNTIRVVNAIIVVTVKKEGGLGASIGESIGNPAQIDIRTQIIVIGRLIVRSGNPLPSS